MSKGGPGDSTSSGTTGSLPNPDFDIISAIQPIPDDELTHLVKNYNGIIEHNGHPVEFNFQHIFEAESIRNGKKLGGFHHDYMGHYREMGLIRNIKMYPNGFYSAEVYFNGKWVTKTFFPEHWTRDQVIKCAIDIFNKAQPKIQGTRTVFQQVFTKKVEVRLVINDVTNKTITLYPILN